MNVRSLLLLVCSAGMLAGVLDSQGGALGAAEAEPIAVQVSRPVTRGDRLRRFHRPDPGRQFRQRDSSR